MPSRAIIIVGLTMIICLLPAYSLSDSKAAAGHSNDPMLLRVMTYNIRAADYGLKGIITTLKEAKADIIVLQEVDKFVKRTGRKNQPKIFGDSLGMQYVFRKHFSYQGGEFGLALLSRYKIDHVERIEVRQSNLALLKARVHTPKHPVTVIVVHFHPLPNPFAKKYYALLFRKVKNEKVSNPLAITEFLHKAKLAKAAYLREVELAKATRLREAKRAIGIATSHDTPFLIMGDFNANSGSAAHNLFDEKFQDCCRIGGGWWVKTWPAKFPITRIDYIWASRHFKVLKCRTLKSSASDHLPVVAEIQLITN